MKCVQFDFSHPFKGTVCLTPLSAKGPPGSRVLSFDTRDSTHLAIPLDGVPEGKWKIVLEWEHEERYFTHSSEINYK